MSKYPSATISEIVIEGGVFTDGDWIESKDQNAEGIIRLIQLADIGDGEFINKSDKHITEMKAIELNCTILKAGDILVARMPDPIGRACIFPDFDYKCVTAVDVCIIRPNNPNVFGKWLMHIINSPKFRNNIQKYSTGTTRKRISRKNLAKIEFPLPPLVEQKRIATILDQADALRRKREQSLSHLDDLMQSVFLEMFGDPIFNSKDLPVYQVESFCDIVRGSSPRPKGDPRYFGGEVPRLMVSDMTRDGYYVTPIIDSLTKEGAEKSRPMKKGSIVMAVSGNVGIVSILNVDGCIHDGIVGFRNLNTNIILPEYLLFVLGLLKRTYETKQDGAIFQNLTTTIVKEIEVPVPSISEQKRWRSFFVNTLELEERLLTSRRKMDELFYSLQHSAFSGQL